MGLFEKFKNTISSSELKSKKSHLRNLYSVAIADGKLENIEFDFLINVANNLYVEPSSVQNIIRFPEDIWFFVPSHNREKIDQIYECVLMAIVDGNLNENEIATCKLIAVKFGFQPVIVDKIIKQILNGIVNNIASEIVINNLLKNI